MAYKTTWSLANKNNIDKQIYEMLTNAMRTTYAFRNKELFFQYTTLLYVKGARRIEPFFRPVTISKYVDQELHLYKITTAVAKHYNTKIKKCKVCGLLIPTKKVLREHNKESGHSLFMHIGARRKSTHYFKAENIYEKALFDYLLKGTLQTTIDFTPLLPPSYKKAGAEKLLEEHNTINGNLSEEHNPILLEEYNNINGNLFNNITEKFNMFKAEISDGQTTTYGSIVPHMLRHIRAYDLWIVHHLRPQLVQRLLDWDDHNMLYHYSDIKNTIAESEELEYYRNPTDKIISEVRL